MKFRISFKTPDAGQYTIDDECERLQEQLREDGVDEDEIEDFVDERRHEMQAELERWTQNGELITVELDTEDHTATVIEP